MDILCAKIVSFSGTCTVLMDICVKGTEDELVLNDTISEKKLKYDIQGR